METKKIDFGSIKELKLFLNLFELYQRERSFTSSIYGFCHKLNIDCTIQTKYSFLKNMARIGVLEKMGTKNNVKEVPIFKINHKILVKIFRESDIGSKIHFMIKETTTFIDFL